MSYIPTGQISARDVRVAGMITLIDRLRRLGKSDDEIARILAKQSGLDRLHPCADPDGRNICSAAEIREAGSRRPTTLAPPTKPTKPTKSKTFLVIGGAVVLLWFLSRKRN